MDKLSKMQNIFRDIFDDEDLILTRETTPDDIEDWNSLMQTNIIIACESEFGVKFKMDDIVNLKSVGDIIDIIERKTGK